MTITTTTTTNRTEFSAEPTDAEEVSVLELANEAGKDPLADYYLRVFADARARELRVYLETGEPGEGDYVTAAVGNVNVSTNTDRYGEPTGFDLHYTDAGNLVAFLTCLAKERSDARLTFTYYEEAGREMMKDTRVREEMIIVKYVTDTGRMRRVGINSVYRSKTNMVARHDSGVRR